MPPKNAHRNEPASRDPSEASAAAGPGQHASSGPAGDEGRYRILEGIVTSVNPDGTANIAPMGPAVDRSMSWLWLRPFQSSRTFQNLARCREGVLHVTDDVELLSRAAIGRLVPPPELAPAAAVRGHILVDVCRWYAFRVDSIDAGRDRARIVARVVDRGRVRDFFGFNRAKHAVLEGAILATRLAVLPASDIRAEMDRLAVWVEKTGGAEERRAFRFLQEHIAAVLAGSRADASDASPQIDGLEEMTNDEIPNDERMTKHE